MKKKQATIDFLTAFLPVLLFATVTGIFFDVYYDLNDDIAIRDILSGAFTGTPDGHAVYVSYPLAALIALLYRIIPVVPWFGLFEMGCLYGSAVLVSYSLIRRAATFREKCTWSLTIALLFEALVGFRMIFVTYTVVAGILAGTGGVLYYLQEKADGARRHLCNSVPAVMLEILAFCLRPQMMLLLLPMVGVLYLAKYAETEISRRERPGIFRDRISFFAPLLVVVILMGAGNFSNHAAYAGEAWKAYTGFNEARTEVMDFQYYVPEYEAAPELYRKLGLDRTEAALLNFDNYNIALDPAIDGQVYRGIAEYNADVLGVTGRHPIGYSFRLYLYTLYQTSQNRYAYVIIAAYFLLALLSIVFRNGRMLVTEIALFAARSVSWIYLMHLGRIRDRITIPLCFAELLTMVILIVTLLWKQERKKHVWSAAVWAVIFCLSAIGCAGSYKAASEETERREIINSPWVEAAAYFAENPNCYYAVDTMSSVDYSGKMFDGRDDRYRNYEIVGGWVVKNPNYRTKISVLGEEDIMKALTEARNYYFVAKNSRDLTWLTEYAEYLGGERAVSAECVYTTASGGDDALRVYRLK